MDKKMTTHVYFDEVDGAIEIIDAQDFDAGKRTVLARVDSTDAAWDYVNHTPEAGGWVVVS